MADPHGERSISVMTWIAFILAFVACLLGIVLNLPTPVEGAMIPR